MFLFALPLPPPAQAQYPGGGYPGGGGSYSGPSYTGGQTTATWSSSPSSTWLYSQNVQDGTWGGAYYAQVGANTASSTVTCSGTINTTFNWNTNGNSNSAPPECVILREYCRVSWNSANIYGGASVTGDCNNPLGGVAVPYTPGTGQIWEYTKYTAMNNPPTTITTSPAPSANASASGGSPSASATGPASVKYSASILTPSPLQGHSTVDTANWDPTHPRFFSGTNCSVNGTASAYSAPPGNASYPAGGSYVMNATLYIGGTAVKFYDDASAYGPFPVGTTVGTNQASVALSVFFDSTYFADASSIPAKMTVTDSGGFTYTVNLSGPACNNLVAVANLTNSWIDYQTGENVTLNATNGTAKGTSSQLSYQPCPGVVVQSTPSNIGIGISPIGTHHRAVLINDIATSGYTVFFAATHADPGLLGDCYSLSDNNIGAYLNDTDIRGAITTRTAALSAPYLFVFLHGCDSGGNTGLADDFGVTSSNDTGFAGFGAAIYVSQHNTNFTVDAWQYLMQGQKLLDALSAADSDFPVQAFINPNTPPDKSGVTIPVPRGDNNMTLYGKVYNWTSGPTWYR